MTNREWLNSLSDEELAKAVQIDCDLCPAWNGNGSCYRGGEHCVRNTKRWLAQEYEPPKKELTQAQLCEAFELKFGNRRAISLDEVREVTREIFK
jgi:hypothetical protein